MHIAFRGSSGASRSSGRRITNLVALHARGQQVLLHPRRMVHGPLPTGFSRDQFGGRLLQGSAQSEDVRALLALTSDPAAQDLPGHGGSPGGRPRRDQGLGSSQIRHHETVLQHRRQRSPHAVVGLDETQGGVRLRCRRGARHRNDQPH